MNRRFETNFEDIVKEGYLKKFGRRITDRDYRAYVGLCKRFGLVGDLQPKSYEEGHQAVLAAIEALRLINTDESGSMDDDE